MERRGVAAPDSCGLRIKRHCQRVLFGSVSGEIGRIKAGGRLSEKKTRYKEWRLLTDGGVWWQKVGRCGAMWSKIPTAIPSLKPL